MRGWRALILLLGISALWDTASVDAQTCTGGIEGVQSTSLDVCCVAECGQCGGPGCTPANTSSLTSGDCCATEVVDSGVMCADTGAAPCILSTEAAPADSTCNNGQTGVQDPDTDVCCPLECGSSCGGEGCGTVPGVDPSQCCTAAIFASGAVCSDTVDPPCVQESVAAANSTCSNGLAGIESQETCCDAACGVCGGPTCGNVPGLTGADCCVTDIQESGSLCSVTGAAPCIVDPPAVAPSSCPNGIAGYASGDICCAEACGQCGGAGCGAVPGTNGADDCCLANIAAANISCGAAPCVMVPGTFTPSPVAANTAVPGATIAPTAGSRDISFTMAPTPRLAPTSSGATPAPTRAEVDPAPDTPAPTPATPAPRGVTLAPLAGDVNGDGLVNSADTGIVGDTNGDGVVDDLDTGLVGDTNGDGVVDSSDEVVGDANGDGLVNSGDTGIEGDTNGDGVVDDADTGVEADTNDVGAADESVGAPLVAIVGGVIGAVLVLGVIITAALYKTGHLKFQRGGTSLGQAAAAPAHGSATAGTQYPVAGPAERGTHYPSAGPAERGTHYPSVVQYPEPAA